MSKNIKYALIAGTLFLFVRYFLEPIILYLGDNFFSSPKFIILSQAFVFLVGFILYVVFIYGFKIVAEKYQNKLLKISSYILIISCLFYLLGSFLALQLPLMIVFRVFFLFIYGASIILFGIALLKLRSDFGFLATGTGILGIIYGIFIFFPFFQILILIFYALNLVILFKANKKVETIPIV